MTQCRIAGGRLDRPPPPGARATFTAGFGRRFAIFGDAEEEFDWHRPFARDNVSTTAIASLPVANRRFVERGLVPTYLVDWPVVANRPSADAIARMVAEGECEVGTQLHPWVNPPFAEEVCNRNSYAGNLPPALERAKLFALTDRIEQATGVRPIVYRAGRYGIGASTHRFLEEAGYRMDVSIRSLYDYSAQSGPDFSAHPTWPWWVSDTLLEVPLTTAFTGRLARRPGLYRFHALRSALSRAQLVSRISLTPEGTPLRDALDAIRRLLDDGTALFSLSFHTPSVEIGHTPYVRDQADLTAFWRWWDGVFDLFAAAGVTAARGSEILAAARFDGAAPGRTAGTG